MKVYSIIFISVAMAVVLLSGCANQAGESKISDSYSKCRYNYDGTWKGVIADSGSLDVWRYSDDGEAKLTHNPFTAQYDFEMTIKRKDGSGDHCNYDITYVKASHPIFGCANGCTPSKTENEYGGEATWLSMEGKLGSMFITFSNGAEIPVFSSPGSIEASGDGQKLMLYIQEGQAGHLPIGSKMDGEIRVDIETDNCERLGGEGDCSVSYINKNTIILNKLG